MISDNVQQEVALQLRELADKVERSRHCTIQMNEERYSFVYGKGGELQIRAPTGERVISIRLTYFEEEV